ncbi:MAG: DUF4337 domain-containing protein [Burkholderiales bacterium]
MTSEEVHVPHHPHGPERGLAQWVAIFTALMATFGAVVGHEASETANDAILLKNEAVLKKTEASNQWAYYQQVSTKGHLMELAKALTPAAKHEGYDEKLAKYAKQKEEIQARANEFERQVSRADGESTRLRKPRLNFAFALTLLQIAISVASVTILTGRVWLFAVAVLSALGGLGFWLSAMLAH